MALVRNFRLPIGIGISADYIETFGTIESSDTNTGSVVARGGAGIAGTLNVGGNINLHYGNYYTGFKSSSIANTVYTLPQNTPAFGSSVLSSSSSGLMHWDDVHALLNIDRATYGSFYSNQAQQVTAANIATPITLNSTFESYKVSIYGGSGTSSRIKIDTAGTYNVQFSAQVNLTSGTQPQVGDFWFKINGSDVPESNTRMSILGKDYETVIALNFVYTFTAGQYFELYMSSSDSNWRLERATGITNPTRPAIPSIIMTVTPVAETVGGSGSGNTGILSINGLNSGQQYIELGSAGTLPNIDSSGFTHTINIPIAGSGSTGLITTNAQTIAGSKTFSSAIIGNLSGTATTSENVNVTTTTRSLTHYLTFTNVSNGSGLALTTSAIGIGFTVNPAQNTLAAGTFVGNLSGTAATTGILKVTSTSGTALNIADRVTVYTVDNFEGLNINSNYNFALSVQDKSNNNRFIVDVGNARTIFTGSSADHEIRVYNQNQSSYFGLKANSTGTQTYILPPGGPSTGSSILQSDNLGNMIWVPMTTGGLTNAITSINSQTGPAITLQKGSSGTDFDITSSSNTITFDLPDASASNRGLVTTGSQTFAGTKTFSSSILGNLSGTSTTSENVNVNTTTRSVDHYLIFTNSSSGSGVALTTSTVGSGLTYNPATNTLNALFFTGTATSSRNVHTAQYTNNNVHYLTFTLQGSGAGAALSTSGTAGKLTYRPADEQLGVTYITGTAFTATNLYGTLTGNVTGTATTSENVNVTTTTRSVDHYLLFTNRSGGSGVALTTSIVGMGLTYNPATNTLAAQFFTGTATTSRNVVVNTTTINQNHFLLFSNRSSGSGIALTASTIGIGFTVNPAENTLSAGLFAGNISGTGATFARATFTNDTEATDQLTGSVTFAGGIAVNKKVFAQSVETNGNVIVAGNFQAYGSIIQLGNAGLADTIGFICRIQSVMIPQANNSFDIGLNDGSYGWRNAAFAGHGTFANLYGSSSANLTGVEFSAGDVLVKSGKTVKFYEPNNTYNTSFKANSSLAANTDYTLPVARPGTGASILQSDNSGNMIWVKAASPKATYVLSFGAGFTPTTGLDSVSIAIPYANDGSTSLTYTIKRVEVRTETEPGASGLAFYFERHTTGNVTWASANTIKGAASANFSVAQNNYSAAFTTITSSSGNNGEVQSGNYLRVNFASVGAAANVSISIMIQEN
jgi:hypothetical protein